MQKKWSIKGKKKENNAQNRKKLKRRGELKKEKNDAEWHILPSCYFPPLGFIWVAECRNKINLANKRTLDEGSGAGSGTCDLLFGANLSLFLCGGNGNGYYLNN